jgi:flavin-dependent dehydrogenase
MGPEQVEETHLTGHRIPVAPRHRRARGGLLLAGDAAGLADPLTGEGISFAIRSGRMAGEAILAAGDRPGRAAGHYDALLARAILPEIRTARVLAALLYGLPRTAFRTLGRSRRFPELVAETFAGKSTYRALLRRALRRPWRLLHRD